MSSPPVSVVIISFNAAATIEATLASAAMLTDDVVVVDSGSTDGTAQKAAKNGARLIHLAWKGFGYNKNYGNKAAKYDWIMSVDADEALSPALIQSIQKLSLSDENVVYKIKRLNYLDKQPIYHGEWSNDWTIRLFNRKRVQWNDRPVHESLTMPADTKVYPIKGWLHHYTASNIAAYTQKLDKYAVLMAKNYKSQGKKGIGYKMYLSPLFSFLKHYVAGGGWLDKKAGWLIAYAHARYTFKKYKTLHALNKSSHKENDNT